MESFAQAVAYGLNATKHVDPWVPVSVRTFTEIVRTENHIQLGINVGLLLIIFRMASYRSFGMSSALAGPY